MSVTVTVTVALSTVAMRTSTAASTNETGTGARPSWAFILVECGMRCMFIIMERQQCGHLGTVEVIHGSIQ